jgi:hypothetical protein
MASKIEHRAILDATLQYQREILISEPIDFVFDEFGPVVREGWELFAATRPPELKELLGRPSRFERDDECLLAWHAREDWLKHGSLTAAPLLTPSGRLSGLWRNQDRKRPTSIFIACRLIATINLIDSWRERGPKCLRG